MGTLAGHFRSCIGQKSSKNAISGLFCVLWAKGDKKNAWCAGSHLTPTTPAYGRFMNRPYNGRGGGNSYAMTGTPDNSTQCLTCLRHAKPLYRKPGAESLPNRGSGVEPLGAGFLRVRGGTLRPGAGRSACKPSHQQKSSSSHGTGRLSR